MKIRLIGHTTSKLSRGDIEKDFRAFAGANAGICYMKESYTESISTDREKAAERFDRVVKTGHHSVAEHVQATVLFEGIPKIAAMFLNNMGIYATSEKSGRYTEMTGGTEKERGLYIKWVERLKTAIKEEYGEKLSESRTDKLARENARYFLSVFTETTMSYTTSLRMWNYIIEWMETYDFDVFEAGVFKDRLKQTFQEICEGLRGVGGLYINSLRDIKGKARVLIDNTENGQHKREGLSEIGEMYVARYRVSFAGLGQLQRHRTLKYIMAFQGQSESFYVPRIIRGTEMESEWLSDMSDVACIIPQGTLIDVKEKGDVEDFLLKCTERLCGRVQLEVMENTETVLGWIVASGDRLPPFTKEALKGVYTDGRTRKKCEMLTCQEVCEWGKRYASERKI